MGWGHGQLRGTGEQCLEAAHAPRPFTKVAQFHNAEVYRLLQSSVTFPDFPEFMI
jgi:hypothetical protein